MIFLKLIRKFFLKLKQIVRNLIIKIVAIEISEEKTKMNENLFELFISK